MAQGLLEDVIPSLMKQRAVHEKILVHCSLGYSRSVLLVLALLMKVRHVIHFIAAPTCYWSLITHQERQICLADAFRLVKDKRHGVGPRLKFMRELLRWERVLARVSALEYNQCWL